MKINIGIKNLMKNGLKNQEDIVLEKGLGELLEEIGDLDLEEEKDIIVDLVLEESK